LQKGEKILIEVCDGAEPLGKALIDEAYKIGAYPYVIMENEQLFRAYLMGLSEPQLKLIAELDAKKMSSMNAYIKIMISDNLVALSDVPEEKMMLFQKYYEEPVHYNIRVPNTKWCKLRFPNPSTAQSANMSTEQFENFYYNVCNLDYGKMSKAMEPLVKLMEKTDKVRIVGPGTDLTFSIKGIPVIKCSGNCNIPDGEVYTAPVKNSINGYITYNTQSLYLGTTFENIRFEFKDGKIIKATSNYTEKINKILDTDKGARYIGEFSIGLNPYIENPMKDILFDEKIKGSFHLTPGDAYDEAYNGNDSAIHWDIVAIQTPEYGGGEIWFDGKLIRKDGRFVLPELQGLNPENLK